jgi:hypothetical protein
MVLMPAQRLQSLGLEVRTTVLPIQIFLKLFWGEISACIEVGADPPAVGLVRESASINSRCFAKVPIDRFPTDAQLLGD